MLEMRTVAAAAVALALAASPAGTERITKQNAIETLTDLATNITPNVCKVQAKRFASAWPALGEMNQAAQQAFLLNREERCVQELKGRFGMTLNT